MRQFGRGQRRQQQQQQKGRLEEGEEEKEKGKRKKREEEGGRVNMKLLAFLAAITKIIVVVVLFKPVVCEQLERYNQESAIYAAAVTKERDAISLGAGKYWLASPVIRGSHSSQQSSAGLAEAEASDRSYRATWKPLDAFASTPLTGGSSIELAASGNPFSSSSKTNPLIESGSRTELASERERSKPQGATSGVDGPTSHYSYKELNSTARHQQHRHQLRHRRDRRRRRETRGRRQHLNLNGKNIRPLFKDNDEEDSEEDLVGWCHRDCSFSSAGSSGSICASDGHLYKSMCQLRRQSCRKGLRLFRRPQIYCHVKRRAAKLASEPIVADYLDNVTTTRANLDLTSSSSQRKVRVVELKRRCNRVELEEMKLLLLRKFNGDIRSMFKHFDSNGDNLIEANELWPRKSIEEGETNQLELIYAQVLADQYSSSKLCNSVGSSSSRQMESGNEHLTETRDSSSSLDLNFAEKEDNCFHLLDFAFEPQFQTNPCSLSHLLLYDWPRRQRFTLQTFENLFLSLPSSNKRQQNLNLETIKKLTRLELQLGQSTKLSCLDEQQLKIEDDETLIGNKLEADDLQCIWTRYTLNLATLRDPHAFVAKEFADSTKNVDFNYNDLELNLNEVQLYHSGEFRCSCQVNKLALNLEHVYQIRVSVEPRVTVRPKFQWSLPGSRISFECHYDYIDTSFSYLEEPMQSIESSNGSLVGSGQFGLQVSWLKNDEEIVLDSKQCKSCGMDLQNGTNLPNAEPENGSWESDSSLESNLESNNRQQASKELKETTCSTRASITLASSRLTLDSLQLNDTGYYTCRVQSPKRLSSIAESKPDSSIPSTSSNSKPLDKVVKEEATNFGLDRGSLLVQEQPKAQEDLELLSRTYLWVFHDNGISVYKLQNDDSQEMELVKEINGHSAISGEVDGNWNQLTLCGGLNPEQVVICEWSDNALFFDVKVDAKDQVSSSTTLNNIVRKYVYVGQPNLNRLIVIDGFKFEIVAIINTEPQPRKLFPYKVNKIHLSKWVRRRLSPKANAHWLSLAGSLAHPLDQTPAMELYNSHYPDTRAITRARRHSSSSSSSNSLHSLNHNLVQHDIWLLCYGQPMVVDPSGNESELDNVAIEDTFYSNFEATKQPSLQPSRSTDSGNSKVKSPKPFAPLLSSSIPFAWSAWSNRESRLRNRKSVHIVQSTFFPRKLKQILHNHNDETEEVPEFETTSNHHHHHHHSTNSSIVQEFKSSTVLSTHHIFAGLSNQKQHNIYLTRGRLDLIQDLHVSTRPYSLERNDKHQIHYAYVTHYDERRLFRISMDEYQYDKEIDLENCDPVNLMTTAHGLLVVQCRTPITHSLSGQLVLDQLTNSRIEYNANIRAQESYLSPDNRYLVSVYTNSSLSTSTTSNQFKRAIQDDADDDERKQSIIYIQSVTNYGLKLQYEIKTSLEICQCSFVWKDGYYAAIFVSTNRREQKSEILSLRLADSRLELMARIPGLVSSARHKYQLIVSPELSLAALSTNQGTFVVDLEDNRVSQSLRRHQSPPTLLWV